MRKSNSKVVENLFLNSCDSNALDTKIILIDDVMERGASAEALFHKVP